MSVKKVEIARVEGTEYQKVVHVRDAVHVGPHLFD